MFILQANQRIRIAGSRPEPYGLLCKLKIIIIMKITIVEVVVEFSVLFR